MISNDVVGGGLQIFQGIEHARLEGCGRVEQIPGDQYKVNVCPVGLINDPLEVGAVAVMSYMDVRDQHQVHRLLKAGKLDHGALDAEVASVDCAVCGECRGDHQ